MNMFANMMSNLVDKEQMTIDTIKDAIERVAKEFNLAHNEISFFIQPKNKEFDFKVYATKLKDGKPVGILREVTVSEIVNPPAEQDDKDLLEGQEEEEDAGD